MDKETPWILKMLSERKISAQSAARILRALEILQQIESGSQVEGLAEEDEAKTPESSERRETEIWADVEKTAENMRMAEPPFHPEELYTTTIQEADEPPDWSEVEDLAHVMREAESEFRYEYDIPSVQVEQEENLSYIWMELAEIDEDMREAETLFICEFIRETELELIAAEESFIEEEIPEEEHIEEEERLGAADDDYSQQLTQQIEAIQETIPSEEETLIETGLEENTEPSIAGGIVAEDEAETVTEEDLSQKEYVEISDHIEPKFGKELALSDMEWTDIGDKLLQDDGSYILPEISDETVIIFEKSAGNIKIQGWDQQQMMIEGEKKSFSVLEGGRNLKVVSEGDIDLYLPPVIEKIYVSNESGLVDIENHTCDISVESETDDISISKAGGSVNVVSVAGNVILEGFNGKAWLESRSGNITVINASEFGMDAPENIISLLKTDAEVNTITNDQPVELSVKTVSGKITLENIEGDIAVKSEGGNVDIRACRSQRVRINSNGGDLNLRDVADNIDIRVENGKMTVEDFFGKVEIKAKNTDVFISKSGDSQIHIESDEGDINIEDCYADVNIKSGTGNVYVSGGNLSFGGMGKVDINLENGNAYLDRRTFEDIRIAVGDGNVELRMEKLNSGGTGRISIYRGDIDLKVSPNFQCELTAHAPRKKVHIDLPIKILEKDKELLKGMLNGGDGATIELIAPNGEIQVQGV
jgi:DUF4097 and DUF4098 domain-containing protein YvlB